MHGASMQGDWRQHAAAGCPRGMLSRNAHLAEELRDLWRRREVACLAKDGAVRIVPRAGVCQHLLWSQGVLHERRPDQVMAEACKSAARGGRTDMYSATVMGPPRNCA